MASFADSKGLSLGVAIENRNDRIENRTFEEIEIAPIEIQTRKGPISFAIDEHNRLSTTVETLAGRSGEADVWRDWFSHRRDCGPICCGLGDQCRSLCDYQCNLSTCQGRGASGGIWPAPRTQQRSTGDQIQTEACVSLGRHKYCGQCAGPQQGGRGDGDRPPWPGGETGRGTARPPRVLWHRGSRPWSVWPGADPRRPSGA